MSQNLLASGMLLLGAAVARATAIGASVVGTTAAGCAAVGVAATRTAIIGAAVVETAVVGGDGGRCENVVGDARFCGENVPVMQLSVDEFVQLLFPDGRSGSFGNAFGTDDAGGAGCVEKTFSV